jgi:hypothetical protein
VAKEETGAKATKATSPRKTTQAAQPSPSTSSGASASTGTNDPSPAQQEQAKDANASRSMADAGMVPQSPASGQYGTHEGVQKEGDKIADAAAKSTGSYAISADASPLTPVDQHTQVVPAAGNPTSTTNPVAANASHQPQPGEQHYGLEDEDGNAIDADSLFDKPDGPQTWVTASKRTYERYRYPGGKTDMVRLLYPQGARVDLLTASRVQAAVKAQAAPG